ncbi:MAG: hypothetical protein AB1414_08595 [bacterium]
MKLIETNRNLWKFVVSHNQFQSISIILSPYHPYLLIPFRTLLIYSLNGYNFPLRRKERKGINYNLCELCVFARENFYLVFTTDN